MPEAGSFTPQEYTSSGLVLSRRMFLGLSVDAVALFLLSACGGDATVSRSPTVSPPYLPPSPTGESYLLTESSGVWIDEPLEKSGKIGRLRFFFDPDYEEGSLALEFLSPEEGALRIDSQEKLPNPRFLLDDYCPYPFKAGIPITPNRHPITRFGKGDVEIVYLSWEKNSHQNMRTYEATRLPDKGKMPVISVKFLGITSALDPSQIKPEQSRRPCLN